MTATTVFDELRETLARQTFDGWAVGIDLGTTKRMTGSPISSGDSTRH